MKLVVLDAQTIGDDLSLDCFRTFGELTVYPATSREETVAHLQGAEIALLNKVRLDAEILRQTPSLRLICVLATGFDNIDLNYCRQNGIAVCNVVGYSTQCVAQLTVAMALSLMTHLAEYTETVRSGRYTADGVANRLTPVYHEIAGKTWGIVGFGNIGKQVGTVAQALGCRVLVHKRTPIEGWECVDLDTVCRESDILSIHTPLNDSTRGMIDRKHLALMKKDAILINVARGAVTDEEAVAEAIRTGTLGGFGVDVYSKEPFGADHPFSALLGLPNVCMTPHMAWGGYETRLRLLDEVCANIRSFLAGERRNRVD